MVPVIGSHGLIVHGPNGAELHARAQHRVRANELRGIRTNCHDLGPGLGDVKGLVTPVRRAPRCKREALSIPQRIEGTPRLPR